MLPTAVLDADTAWRAGHGLPVELDEAVLPDGELLLIDPDGAPVCVAELRDGRAKPRVGFRA